MSAGEEIEEARFRCFICLEDFPIDEASNVLKCVHQVCGDCLGQYWVHEVMKESSPFPGCPMRACSFRASYRQLQCVLVDDVMRRVRQLQALKPARAADGRPMFCIAEGCMEPLPPPPPPPPQNEDGTPSDNPQNMVTVCPECGVAACLRCGGPAHGDSECARPLPDERQVRLYNSYAVGRVGSCPRCGVHIVRDGGCQRVVCARCGCAFEFRPFANTEEAADAAVEGSIPAELLLENDAAAQLPGVSMFLMTWGAGFSGVPLAGLLGALNTNSGDLGLARIFFLPFIILGVPTFVGAVVSFARYLATEVLPHFGNLDRLPPARGAQLLVMSASFTFLAVFLQYTFLNSAGAVAVIYLAPFVVYAVGLFVFNVLHFSTILVRLLIARHRGWRGIDGIAEADVDLEAGTAESNRTANEV